MYSCKKARCERCRMHEELCICAKIPRLETRTRVEILMHAQERHKPSNTGRLAHLCLPNSDIRYRGEIGKPMSLEGLVREDYQSVFLALTPQSLELTPELVAGFEKPVQLIVPDGTWAQASRMSSKIAPELGVPLVKLRADQPSQYRLRSEHHPDGMATFEAIARALGVLERDEGPRVRGDMEKIFRIMTDRALYTRGKLRAEEVYGGLS